MRFFSCFITSVGEYLDGLSLFGHITVEALDELTGQIFFLLSLLAGLKKTEMLLAGRLQNRSDTVLQQAI